MTKKDLIQAVASKADMTKKDTETFYNSLIDVLTEEVNRDTEINVEIPAIGTMKVTLKAAHQSKNPKTGEIVEVPDRRQIRISVSDTLKKKLIQPSEKKTVKKVVKKK
jgi:nucleoid DNA-binding protein